MLDAVTVTQPASDGDNEDFLLLAGNFALVLDGVTRYPVADIGCGHSVGWYVSHLGGRLGHALAVHPGSDPLVTLLADSIARTAADHASECDLRHPLTPAATVAIVREAGGRLDWLVLADATVAWLTVDGDTDAVTDCRPDQRREGGVSIADARRDDVAHVARVRNVPGGFWVAAADPAAAREALTGSLPADQVSRVGLFTDGVTRLVQRYGRSWADLFAMATATGARSLVDAVRAEEQAGRDNGRWHGKIHDDATAIVATVKRG